MKEPPEESQKAVQIQASQEMINVLLGEISDGGSWPVEFAPEESDVGVISIQESEWEWNEPEVPGHEMVILPCELVKDNVKIEFGKYSSWIAVNQIKIGDETYVPGKTLRPCEHPPGHIDTVVLSESSGIGIKWLSYDSSTDSEVLLCKKCKTPL